MQDPEKFSQAMQLFAERENLPASLDSEDWESVPREIRERAFFMSKVTDAEILQKFRDITADVVAGKMGVNDADKLLERFLAGIGYRPAEGKAGGLEDLSSARRIAVVINTNLDMARGHARWLRNQKTLKAFPGQRLVRISRREEVRDWPGTWKAAIGRLGDRTMAVMTRAAGGSQQGGDPLAPWMLAAPVNDPIWEDISRFRQPYPPFDWGSGVGLMPIGRGESKALGILPPPDDPRMQPQQRSLNETLEAAPRVMAEELKQALADKLGRFGDWDGEKMVFTDPDGTRPHTAAKLAEIWAKPAPEGFDTILQRDVLAGWDEGLRPDTADSRVILRRLFDRLQNEEAPPPVLTRSVPMDAAQAVELVRVLTARKMAVPANVAGWSWDTTARASAPEGGWVVTFTLRRSTLAKDVRALRPGKPGWVLVGGRQFKVTAFKQDPKTRRIDIELEEGEQP